MYIETNSVLSREEAPDELKNKIPEGAFYFEWVVSSWEKNRNGYVIDSNAWFFKKWKYVKDFLKTWTILFNHDENKPIGRPLTFELEWDKIKTSWYVFDDHYTNWAIGRWLVLGLSTGHITHKRSWINNDTGEEKEELSFEEWWDWNWYQKVLEAEIVEYSFVSTRSNRDSTIVNSLAEEFKKTPEEINLLLSNKTFMEKEKNEVEGDISTVAPVESILTETIPTVIAEGKGEIKEQPTDQNKFLDQKIDINTLKESLKKEILAELNISLQKEINTLREEKRNDLRAAIVTNGLWGGVKSLKDIVTNK